MEVLFDMLNVRKGRLLTCLSLSLIIGALVIGSANAGLFDMFKGKKKDAAPQMQSLLVFPFDQDSSIKMPSAFGEDLASSLRTMLVGNRAYTVYIYHEKLAPIRRAKDDNAIKPTDATSPFAEDAAKSLKLAQLLASDYYMVGSVDDCQVDAKTKVAQMTLRADLYDAKSGKLIKTFLITGRTPDSVKASGDDELRSLAAGDAVAKLKLELMTADSDSEEKPAAPVAKPK